MFLDKYKEDINKLCFENKVKYLYVFGSVLSDNFNEKSDIDLVVDKLVANNIIVNTVYCTVPGEKKAIKGWERIALKGRGKISTMSIRNKYFDRLNGFDMQKLRALNKKFNNTYLWYGPEGRLRYNRMVDVDNKSYIANTEGFRYRILYKISDDYQRTNMSWDLVDMYSKNPVNFMKVDRKMMNDSCKRMSNDQLKAYIIYKKYERKKIGAMMAEMIINKELKDKEEGQTVTKTMATLDIVTLKAIREMLKNESCECPQY
jgi:hypothetical protein